MRHTIAFVCGILLVTLPVAAKDQDTSKAQVVSTAEIVKIDTKKKSLQVQDLAEVTAPSENRGTRRQGGGGGGGGGRRRGGGGAGGIRLPGGVGFPGGAGGGTPTGAKQAKQYKVFVSKDTVLKLAETNIDFTDLHVGDHITVSGTPKGHDVDAVTITRDFN